MEVFFFFCFCFFCFVLFCFVFHERLKGESVRSVMRGEGKTSELLCDELWRINMADLL